jgi:hypothetical protein
MKELKFDGVELDEQIKGKIVVGGNILVVKISTAGMLVETTEKLRINSHCKFQMTLNGKKTTLSSKVLNVLIKSTVVKKNKNVPLYQAEVEFKNLKESERELLDNAIEQILERKVSLPQNEVQGARFRIKE